MLFHIFGMLTSCVWKHFRLAAFPSPLAPSPSLLYQTFPSTCSGPDCSAIANHWAVPEYLDWISCWIDFSTHGPGCHPDKIMLAANITNQICINVTLLTLDWAISSFRITRFLLFFVNFFLVEAIAFCPFNC